MPVNDPRDYPNVSRPVAAGSKFHTFLPQEKAADDIFGPDGVPYIEPKYPSVPLQGCHLAIENATDDANTLQDMLKELRNRLQPVLREAEPVPVTGSATTEKKLMSPMAEEIRSISSTLGVSRCIIDDILVRLEV